jgi:hypothetical protein
MRATLALVALVAVLVLAATEGRQLRRTTPTAGFARDVQLTESLREDITNPKVKKSFVGKFNKVKQEHRARTHEEGKKSASKKSLHGIATSSPCVPALLRPILRCRLSTDLRVTAADTHNGGRKEEQAGRRINVERARGPGGRPQLDEWMHAFMHFIVGLSLCTSTRTCTSDLKRANLAATSGG